MMAQTHPTAGWERVGERFYRKTQLYTAVFDLDLDLDNFFVSGAPYGGAVGVLTRPISPGGFTQDQDAAGTLGCLRTCCALSPEGHD